MHYSGLVIGSVPGPGDSVFPHQVRLPDKSKPPVVLDNAVKALMQAKSTKSKQTTIDEYISKRYKQPDQAAVRQLAKAPFISKKTSLSLTGCDMMAQFLSKNERHNDILIKAITMVA